MRTAVEIERFHGIDRREEQLSFLEPVKYGLVVKRLLVIELLGVEALGAIQRLPLKVFDRRRRIECGERLVGASHPIDAGDDIALTVDLVARSMCDARTRRLTLVTTV